MRKIGIAIALVGFMVFWMGADGADTGKEDKLWMAATIIGVLFMVLGTLVHQYPIYLQQERAKKSIRYRRYLETQEKMSTQEVVYVKRKADDKKTVSKLQELRTEPGQTETSRRKGLELPAGVHTKLYRT